MKDKENLKLDILSAISEEYVNEVTEARIAAKGRVAARRRTLTVSISAAAIVLILISAFIPLLVGVLSSTVPTYTGMTVSNSSPFGELSRISPESELGIRAVSDGRARAKKPIKDGVKEHFNISAESSIYYANPGEDIYITVKFDNPDDYEILSFTLNGEKYTSYMFEEGSDMENIVLKLNVGEVSGLQSYTIDAIKYVDGDKIKDVKIGGERTVSIGVYNENQPTAEISGISYTESGASFNASVSDPEGLIAETDGKIYALIYDGNSVVAEREIGTGLTEGISFTGLTPETEYTAAIVAVFDAYDGEKTAPHVICEAQFATRISAFAKNITVEGDTVKFDIFSANSSVSVSKIELIDMLGNTIREKDASASEFDGIPGGKLTIRVSYSYELGGELKEGSADTAFVCTEGMLPMIGEISAHYDSGVVLRPDGAYHSGHFGTDIVPTTENMEVYSITDGVITELVKVVYKPKEGIFGCGKVEIRDKDGVYHFYKFVDCTAFSVGDEVKAGDVLGTLCEARELDMTEGNHLHYETYTKSDSEGKTYLVPAFDGEPREIGEQERLEKIAMSEPMLVTGELSVSGEVGSTVTYTTNFDFTYSDESVSLAVVGSSEHIRLEKLESGQWSIICNFEGITEPTAVKLVYFINVANRSTQFCDHIVVTLVPTT